MEEMLTAMAFLSPGILALIVLVAFGLALATREKLGRERGLRESAERARDAAVKTLAVNKDWEFAEIGRFRRLLDTHIDALVAEATEFRDRSTPSPAATLVSLCSWHAHWKWDLARAAGLKAEEVEMLLENQLPITPVLARKLEIGTGAPARYWEYLWRLHDEYRTETDRTVEVWIDELSHMREEITSRAIPMLDLVDDHPTLPEVAPAHKFEPSVPADPLAEITQPMLSAGAAAVELPEEAAIEFAEIDVPPLIAPPTDSASSAAGGRQSPPPRPRLRSPTAPPGQTPFSARASTLTDFPIPRGDSPLRATNSWSAAQRPSPDAPAQGPEAKKPA